MVLTTVGEARPTALQQCRQRWLGNSRWSCCSLNFRTDNPHRLCGHCSRHRRASTAARRSLRQCKCQFRAGTCGRRFKGALGSAWQWIARERRGHRLGGDQHGAPVPASSTLKHLEHGAERREGATKKSPGTGRGVSWTYKGVGNTVQQHVS